MHLLALKLETNDKSLILTDFNNDCCKNGEKRKELIQILRCFDMLYRGKLVTSDTKIK